MATQDIWRDREQSDRQFWGDRGDDEYNQQWGYQQDRYEFDDRSEQQFDERFDRRFDRRFEHRRRARQSESSSQQGLARGLGWFSIALGIAQIAAPRKVAQLAGLPGDPDTCAAIRAVGMREMATGAGILAQPNQTGWLLARVGGDIMDIAMLAGALQSDYANRDRVGRTMIAIAGIASLDLFSSGKLDAYLDEHSDAYRQRLAHKDRAAQLPMFDEFREQRRSKPKKSGIHVKKALTINRPPEEVYGFWRNFSNLPQVMSHLKSVEIYDEQRSRWIAKAPLGMEVEWDAEIIDDRPNELIAWRSLEGADVNTAGIVRFRRAPGNRGTEVRVELQYQPPGGALGAQIAKLFGEEPEQQIQEDLRRFKQVLETGQITLSEATIKGKGLWQQPAQPPKKATKQQQDANLHIDEQESRITPADSTG